MGDGNCDIPTVDGILIEIYHLHSRSRVDELGKLSLPAPEDRVAAQYDGVAAGEVVDSLAKPAAGQARVLHAGLAYASI